MQVSDLLERIRARIIECGVWYSANLGREFGSPFQLGVGVGFLWFWVLVRVGFKFWISFNFSFKIISDVTYIMLQNSSQLK